MKNSKLLFFFVIVGVVTIAGGVFFASRPRLKPNVIIITIDALRSDHLGCYGYKRATSPNIDGIAREGVLFTQAIATATHTPPSMGTIATGVLPYQHLLYRWGCTLNVKIPVIAEVLRHQGYATAFLGNNHTFHSGLHGFSRGFDFFHEDDSEAAITDRALEYVRSFSRPFFIWLHYMNVHAPYTPSEKFKSLFVHDALYDPARRLPVVKEVYNEYGYHGISETLAKATGGITNPDYYIALYDAAIRTVDEAIGRILGALQEQKLDKKTIIIVTADHGEMLGEHQYYFHHGWFVYEPLIRIPFIIKAASLEPGRRIEEQINVHLAIMPTILGMLGVRRQIRGERLSLLPLLTDGRSDYLPSWTTADAGYCSQCVRTKKWKLIYNGGNEQVPYELYDLVEDPREEQNLYLQKAGTVGDLKRTLDVFAMENKKVCDSLPAQLDPETKDRLRSLGYIQ